MDLIALLVSFSACDAEGWKIFSHEDAKQIANYRLEMLARLAVKALELSGLDPNVAGELASEAARDLKKTPSSSSSIDSGRSSKRARRKS